MKRALLSLVAAFAFGFAFGMSPSQAAPLAPVDDAANVSTICAPPLVHCTVTDSCARSCSACPVVHHC
jgi:hypothetical protein